MMKNGSISEQLELQNQIFTSEKKKDIIQACEKESMISCNLDSKHNEKHAFSQGDNKSGDSLLSIFSLGDGNNYNTTSAEELQAQKRKKKKKKGIRR